MSKFKDSLIEIEQMLGELLTDEGMTNEQALKTIEVKLGSLAKDYAKDVLARWNNEETSLWEL